jgi:hypothetical protein
MERGDQEQGVSVKETFIGVGGTRWVVAGGRGSRE